MIYHKTVDGRLATLIGFDGNTGLDAYRVGDETIYVDRRGCSAGVLVIATNKGSAFVLFHDGTWTEFTNYDTLAEGTAGQDVREIFWAKTKVVPEIGDNLPF